jgi:tRNA dimethylallyltransferase
MYYNGLLNGISKLPHADATMRNDLLIKGENIGFDKLHQELMAVDGVSAAKIMPTDRQRIIRALEVFYLTGIPISRLQAENKVFLAAGIDFLPLAILPDKREILHTRINARFDQMLSGGLIDEVKQLQIKYPELTINHTSMRSVGYYQAWEYLSGNMSYPELVETGKAATRQLAKRQITWMRGMNIINLDNGELSLDYLFENLLNQVNLFLK